MTTRQTSYKSGCDTACVTVYVTVCDTLCVAVCHCDTVDTNFAGRDFREDFISRITHLGPLLALVLVLVPV